MKRIFLLFFTIFSFAQLLANDLVWSSPVTLSGSMSTVSSPRIAMDLNGNAMAAWVENGFTNASYFTQPSMGMGSWGMVHQLSATATASAPVLRVDGSGNVTAVWIENNIVMSATFNGMSWSAETAVSSSGASSPALAVDNTGNAVAVWVRSGFIESATKLFGGSWSLVSVLSAGSSDNPDVAIGANGTVCAVWHSVVSGADNVLSSTQTIASMAAGPWSSPLTIATGGFSHNYPHIVVDLNGNSTAVWFRYIVSGSIFDNVQVATGTLVHNGSAWSPVPTFLSGFGSRNPADLSLKVVTDSVGNLLALWSQSYDGSSFNIESAQQPNGRSWSPVSEIQIRNIYAFQGDLSPNLLGEVLAGYMFFDGTNVVIQATEASTKGIAPEPFFSNPIDVSAGGENGGYTRVASAFIGSTDTVYAGAIWLNSNGINNTVQAANGSRTSVLPPMNLTVMQQTNNFGIFTEYANTLTWDASPSPDVQAYFIYRNGVQVTNVGASTLQYVDNNMPQDLPVNGTIIYGVMAVDSELSQSPTATIIFP